MREGRESIPARHMSGPRCLAMLDEAGGWGARAHHPPGHRRRAERLALALSECQRLCYTTG